MRKIASHFFHCQGFSIPGPAPRRKCQLCTFSFIIRRKKERNECNIRKSKCQAINLLVKEYWQKSTALSFLLNFYIKVLFFSSIVRLVLLPLIVCSLLFREKNGVRGQCCHPWCYPNQSKQLHTHRWETNTTTKTKIFYATFAPIWENSTHSL